MKERIDKATKEKDSLGGIFEVVIRGLPIGLGTYVHDDRKLSSRLTSGLMSISAIKAVEIGAGMKVKEMTGSVCNDQMSVQNGKVIFESNNAGGITGGLTTGQDIVIRLAVKPTPTIARPQKTIDKVSVTNAELKAVTRRDPTIVSRIWPVAEALQRLFCWISICSISDIRV